MFISISLVLFSCVEIEPVSPIPEITFKSLTQGIDTSMNQVVGILKFDFIDGDADIGIYPGELVTDSPGWDKRYYNVFLVPYRKSDTIYYPIEIDSTRMPPPYYTIMYNEKLDRVGQNKTIKGTINILIVDLPLYDTIKYDFYIRDRAGNYSNTETTTDMGTRIPENVTF